MGSALGWFSLDSYFVVGAAVRLFAPRVQSSVPSKNAHAPPHASTHGQKALCVPRVQAGVLAKVFDEEAHRSCAP